METPLVDLVGDSKEWHGVVAILICSFCFGTVYVPIRKFHTGGNGKYYSYLDPHHPQFVGWHRCLYNMGLAFFVQWVMSVGILLTGFIVNILEAFPPMQPLAGGFSGLWSCWCKIEVAVFGGMLWCVANNISQFVISGLGIAVAMLLWNTTNCLTGWASGRFGLFGLTPSVWAVECRQRQSLHPVWSRYPKMKCWTISDWLVFYWAGYPSL